MAENAAAGKKAYIAALKVLAILLVIFNHVRDGGFHLYITASDSPVFPVYLFSSAACKVAVPLFFMCSGALLLGRDEPLKKLFTHRILRYAAVLVLFTFIEYLYEIRHDFSGFDLSFYLRTIYARNIYGFFWFLYAYLGCLFMLPFLRKLARALKGAEFAYLIALQLIFTGVIPALEYVIGRNAYLLNPDFKLPLIAQGVFYMLVGYWAGNVLDTAKLRRAHLSWTALAGMAGVALGCLLVVYRAGIDGRYDSSQGFFNYFIAIPTIAAFVLAKCAFERLRWSPRALRAILYAGELTFGIYLTHIMVMRPFKLLVRYVSPYLGQFPTAILMVLAVAIVAGAGTALVRKIPGVSKLL